MNFVISIFICFIPLLITVCISLVLKKYKLSECFIAILCGFIAFLPISIILFLLNKYFYNFLEDYKALSIIVLIINCVIEETVKMLCLKFLPIKRLSLLSFIASSFTAGIALGSFEALVYLISGTGTLLIRLCTAVILHGVCALLSGIFIWKQKKIDILSMAFFLAIILHCVYNFFSAIGGVFFYLSFIVIVFGFFQSNAYYTDLYNKENSSNTIGEFSENS